MTFRERIADWISGGNYFEALRLAGKMAVEMVAKHNLAVKRGDALNSIAACETPSANATVRKMARIAREATE